MQVYSAYWNYYIVSQPLVRALGPRVPLSCMKRNWTNITFQEALTPEFYGTSILK
jgi:hypothetical protein